MTELGDLNFTAVWCPHASDIPNNPTLNFAKGAKFRMGHPPKFRMGRPRDVPMHATSPLSCAALGGGGRRGFLRRSAQQVPGLDVALIFLAFASGGEQEVATQDGADLGGDDVPDVLGDDVDGEEIDLAGLVVLVAAGLEAADVSVAEAGDGGLDLHAQEAAAMVDGEVVAGGVSPGLGDVESVLGGAGHEAEFGPLATLFVVLDNTLSAVHEFWPK
jgi:hypothetical protein